MSKEATVRKEIIEVEVVDVEIDLSKKLYDYLMKCKGIDEEKDGKEYSLGEYMERTFNDQRAIIKQQQDTIQFLQLQLGFVPQVQPKYKAIDKAPDSQPVDPAFM